MGKGQSVMLKETAEVTKETKERRVRLAKWQEVGGLNLITLKSLLLH
jgi:hypothetical protein